MKNLFTFFCFTFISALAFSQAPKYDDLKILYADANYEKLAKVASGYTENDKTKKDILPYIWLSKGLYKISLSGTDDDKFKYAYKDAIKYFGKGLKYDIKYNDGSTFKEHREFSDLFQLSLQELIQNEILSGSFRRAYGWCIKYQKITTHEVGATLMMAACKYEDQDKTTARSLWKEADEELKEITTLEGWSDADRKMLKDGVLNSASAMVKGRQVDSARELLNKVAQWFEEDDDWKTKYDAIIN